MMKMKHVSAFKRGDRILVDASSQTIHGVWFGTGPVLSCDAGDLEGIGRCVVEALNASRQGLPHPTVWEKGGFDHVLRAAGVRSYRAFNKAFASVDVLAEGNTIKFQPTRNLGGSRGYTGQATTRIEIPLPADPDVLGRALLAAFDACE